MTLRLVHISDIHFGQDKNGTLVRHDLVRSGLLKDARDFARIHGQADRILITGDIAYAGKPEEYTTATEWLEQLSGICGCKETDVSVIPGNHDCDIDSISYQSKLLHGQLRASTAEVIQATLHGIAKDGESANPFLPKLGAYRQFANCYACGFESPERPLWIRDFRFPENVTLRLLGLTSVLVSDLDDKEGKMVLGNRQYTFDEEEDIIHVVLVHHPLNWFIDKVEASQIISNNARLLMVGHEHRLNLQKITDPIAKKEHLIVYSGAANPPETGNEYNFTYNWIELSFGAVGDKRNLIVRIFPRVWVPQSVRFEADRTRLGGEESVEIPIACPNVKRLIDEGAASSIDTEGAEMPTQEEDNPADAPERLFPQDASQGDNNESNMNMDSDSFDRLRYLFWRYLNWRQRLKILVEVDALPKTADQPVPQTLERVALEAAQNAGKLHELWEAMMPLIPAEKRTVNPFPAASSKKI